MSETVLDIAREAGHTPVKRGNEWAICCPVHGDRTPSLRLNEAKNVWRCDPCDKGGGARDLRELLGLAVESPGLEILPADQVAPVGAYLRDVRKLAEAEVKLLGAAETHHGAAVAFRYVTASGVKTYDKLLSLDRPGGKKRVWAQPKGRPAVIYGLDWLRRLEQPQSVVIVEGEIDAHSLRSVGIEAVVSVPNGTGTKLTPGMLDPLGKIPLVYLATDADKPGDELAARLAGALPGADLRRVRWGEHKDANEALQHGWGASEFQDALAQAPELAAPAPASVAGDDTEAAALASILDDPTLFHTVELRVEDFRSPLSRAIYESIHSLIYDQGAPVDVVTVAAEARRLGHAGVTSATLDRMRAASHTASVLPRYAATLRNLAIKGQVDKVLAGARQMLAKTEPAEALALLEDAYRKGLAASDVAAQFARPAELSSQVLALLEADPTIRPERLETGIGALDRVLGGLPVGHATMLGGRTSMGKTATARCILDNIGARGIPGLYISLEDSQVAIARWLMLRYAGVPDMMDRIRTKTVRQSDIAAMRRAKVIFDSRPFRFCEEPSLTPAQICQRIRQAVAVDKVQVVFVDYLNLVDLPKRHDRKDELADFVKALVRVAKSCKIALVVLAQLNRDSEKEMRAPRLTDFKDCGGIEEVAQIAILVHRPWRYRQNMAKKRLVKNLQAIIAKVKDADTTTAQCYFEGAIGDVRDPDPVDYFDKANLGKPIYPSGDARQESLALRNAKPDLEADDEEEDV